MTKIAYLECPTGIAGDMCLGALVDAGVPLDYLIQSLNRLDIAKEYRLRTERVHRNGQQATKLYVDLLTPDASNGSCSSAENESVSVSQSQSTHNHSSYHHSHYESGIFESGHFHSHSIESSAHSQHAAEPHNHHHPAKPDAHAHHHPATTRHLPEIEQMILAARLPAKAEIWSLAVFRQLAEAEGAVHGISPHQVHFHEVGATDAIVDIVGTCLGLDWLGVDKIYCSALPVGGGTIRAAHGRLPVPAPAVLKLFELRQIPLYSNGIERELVTPTGAAIATTLATQFGSPPSMTLLKVGLGAGSIDLPLPNILRLWIGERGETSAERLEIVSASPDTRHPTPASHLSPTTYHLPPSPPSPQTETVTILETQIDDLNPQAIGYLYDVLLDLGALDVFTQAIGMKKSRPGTLLTVICQPENASACEAAIFRETTTLGIRHSTQQRQILQREIQSVQTDYGTVRIKVAWSSTPDGPTNVQPEYEDCAQIARQHNIPWREVHRVALQAWHSVRVESEGRR